MSFQLVMQGRTFLKWLKKYKEIRKPFSELRSVMSRSPKLDRPRPWCKPERLFENCFTSGRNCLSALKGGPRNQSPKKLRTTSIPRGMDDRVSWPSSLLRHVFFLRFPLSKGCKL